MSEPTKQALFTTRTEDWGTSSKKREANDSNNIFHLYNIVILLKHI